jgi:hypothetical protein
MKFDPLTPSAFCDQPTPRRAGWKALALLVPACGKTPTNTGPTITAVLPQGGSVAREVTIYIDWDRALDPSTWPTSFTLTDNTGTVITCTISFNTTINEISIRPPGALAGGITYTVTILYTLKGTDGKTFAGFAFQFTTEATTVTPPNGGQPTFSGATGASSPATPPGTIVLTWGTATDSPDNDSIVYDIYESTVPNGQDFANGPLTSTANASGITLSIFASNVTYYFVVRARESSTGNTEFNTIPVSATTH